MNRLEKLLFSVIYSPINYSTVHTAYSVHTVYITKYMYTGTVLQMNTAFLDYPTLISYYVALLLIGV